MVVVVEEEEEELKDRNKGNEDNDVKDDDNE